MTRCNLDRNVGNTFVNHTSNDVTATDNWWGTTDAKLIGGLIEDFYDNNQFGRIRFSPAGAQHEIGGLPKLTDAELAFLAACPDGVRAGQGFNRVPGTPPSVTIAWNAGKLEKSGRLHGLLFED